MRVPLQGESAVVDADVGSKLYGQIARIALNIDVAVAVANGIHQGVPACAISVINSNIVTASLQMVVASKINCRTWVSRENDGSVKIVGIVAIGASVIVDGPRRIGAGVYNLGAVGHYNIKKIRSRPPVLVYEKIGKGVYRDNNGVIQVVARMHRKVKLHDAVAAVGGDICQCVVIGSRLRQHLSSKRKGTPLTSLGAGV